MKLKITILLAIFASVFTFAQESKFSLEVNYPLPIDDNFIGKNYNGIAEIGAKYNFLNRAGYALGFSFNAGALNYKDSQISFDGEVSDFKVTAITLQPRFVSQLNIPKALKIRPTFALGYTYVVFVATGTVNGFDASDYESTQSGINANLGVAYDITNNLFVQVQYDYVKMVEIDGAPKVPYNTKINLLKFGFGFRL